MTIAGVIGKSRLERWDAAVNKLAFGEEALFPVILRKIDGFLKKRGIYSIYAKLFNLALIILIVSLGIAAPLYTFFLVALHWATDGRMGISSSEHPPAPAFVINAETALIWIFTALFWVIVLYIVALLLLKLVFSVIFLPYRIVHTLEAQATLERALMLTGGIIQVIIAVPALL